MSCDFWGESPLYENEDLKVGSIPPVTPIDQVRDEGNCGRAIDRGEEACECAVKLTLDRRRQPHSRQSCEPPSAVEKLRTETRYKAGVPVWTGEWAKPHEAVPKSTTPCSFALVN